MLTVYRTEHVLTNNVTCGEFHIICAEYNSILKFCVTTFRHTLRIFQIENNKTYNYGCRLATKLSWDMVIIAVPAYSTDKFTVYSASLLELK